MVVLIVILTIIVFIIVNISLRLIFKRIEESKVKKVREEALDIGLKLDYTDEAVSLKRVEVDNPKARILAVDDESIILDSFRKILVIAGYSIDTVETGKEALGLVRKNDYDFVFTDLKMPEMDGLDVTKAVHHLRPDIDIIMITGFATIESAVDAMKYGAMDHVQKPFTEDELVDFVNKALIRRQDKIDRQIKPAVHLITPSVGASKSKHQYNVPSGVFISPSHTWVRVQLDGLVRIGIDDFGQKALGEIEHVELPEKKAKVQKGETLFHLVKGDQRISIPSPVSGKIVSTHGELFHSPELLAVRPYETGWVCSIEPSDLGQDLQALKIGADAVAWYQNEIDEFMKLVGKISSAKLTAGEPVDDHGEMESKLLDEASWEAFSESFLKKS